MLEEVNDKKMKILNEKHVNVKSDGACWTILLLEKSSVDLISQFASVYFVTITYNYNAQGV